MFLFKLKNLLLLAGFFVSTVAYGENVFQDEPSLVMAIAGNVSYEDIERMIDGGADITKKDPTVGFTPLGMAVVTGNLQIINLLVNRGVNVNAEAFTSIPPVFLTSSGEVMEKLVKKGADINFKDSSGDSVLTKAVASAEPKFIRDLINLGVNTADGKALILAARHNSNPAVLKVLAENQIKQKGKLDASILGEAVIYNKSLPVMNFLIKGMKLDVNARMPYGLTPLMLAALTNPTKEKAEILINAGADINAVFLPGTYPQQSIPDNEFLDSVIKSGTEPETAFSFAMLKNLNEQGGVKIAWLLLNRGMTLKDMMYKGQNLREMLNKDDPAYIEKYNMLSRIGRDLSG